MKHLRAFLIDVPHARRERAFTLVELVIVIAIMAILASVAIPAIMSSGSDSDETALITELAAIRTAISLYRGQHGGDLPGLVAGKPTSDPAATFVNQMLQYSDASGRTSASKSSAYPFGPYLTSRTGFPACPAGKKLGDNHVLAGAWSAALTASADETQAWKYSYVTGEFICNDPSVDSRGKPFSSY